jgi:WD40 repeat protein/tRNA A-37 threonylcarbamoyl transferase component Bud32
MAENIPTDAIGPEPPHEPSDDLERRLKQLADEFLTQLQAGARPDRREWVAKHPEFGDSLDRHLELVERVFHATHTPQASSAAGAPPGEFPGPPLTPSGATTIDSYEQVFRLERARHLQCPHCGNQIQLVEEDADEVTCRNCGSTFHLDTMATRTYRPRDIPQRFGKFKVLEIAGRGGFGIVLKARDTELDCIRALKVPRSGYFTTAEEQERFVREARHAARLKHPHIVQVHEIAYEGRMPYIVSDFIDGMTLADMLTGPRLDYRETAELLATVADALEFAHREQVIHRDIKPSNILMDHARRPYLTDFGLARRDEGEITVTLDGQVIGTPAYMSPEQASADNQHVDARSDIYGLGVILYRVVSGELPFQGNKRMLLHQVIHDEPRPPRALNPTVPRDLETICLHAMAKEPARRYATARELADDLRRWLAGEPIRARPVGATERFWRWCRRNPSVASLAAAVAVLLVTISIVSTYFAAHEYELRGIADGARGREATERGRAEANAEESRGRLVQFAVAQGVRLMDQNDLAGSLVWFTHALGLDDRDAGRAEMHRLRIGAVLRQCPQPTHVWSHGGPVTYGEFSPDGTRVVAACKDGTATLHDISTGRSITLQHAKEVFHATFSPDGRLVATSSMDGSVRIWDAASGEATRPPIQHSDWVRHVSFSPDSKRLAIACNDGTARVWDVASGDPVTEPLKHPANVVYAEFSPDGARLLTVIGSKDAYLGLGQATVWDLETAMPVAPPIEAPVWILAARFDREGRRVVTGAVGGTVRVWDAETSKPISPPIQHGGRVHAVGFSPDGTRIVTASENEMAQVFDAETGSPVAPPLRHHGMVRHAEFSRDGGRIVTASRDGTAAIWNATTGEPLTPSLHHAGEVKFASFSPDSTLLLTTGDDFTARVWSLAVAEPQRLIHEAHVESVAFSRDGRHIATASDDKTARVWDAATAKPVTDPLEHESGVIVVAFSPDGRRIVTGSSKGAARVWEIATGTLVAAPMEHGSPIYSVEFDPRGERILAACKDGTARVWDVETGTLRASLQRPQSTSLNFACFSPDGRWIGTAGEDGDAAVWEADSFKLVVALQHKARVWRIQFSPDGQRCLTASFDSTAKLWEVPSGKQLAAVEHKASVLQAVFSSDGRQFATVSLDGTATICDAATGQRLTTLEHPGLFLRRAKFSADGRRLLTVGYKIFGLESQQQPYGEARLWQVATGTPITPPLRHPGSADTGTMNPDGSRIVTASSDGTARVWVVSPDPRSVETLVEHARLLSGHEIDQNGGYVTLQPAQVRKAAEALRSR